MKKYFFLISAIVLAACSTKAPKETVIRGVFPNFKDSVVFFYNNGVIDTIALDKEKSFTLKVNIEKPNFYMVKAYRARTYFYAKPYDTTSFTLDCSDKSNLPVFKGTYADMNNYLPKSYKIKNGLYNVWDETPSKGKQLFDKQVDSVKKILDAVLDSLSVKDQELLSLEKSHLDYFVRSVKIEYQQSCAQAYADLYGKDINPDSLDYGFMKDIDVNNASHLMFDEYTSNVEKYMLHLFLSNVYKEDYSKKTDAEKKKDFFAFVDSRISSQAVRDHIKMINLLEVLTYGKFYEMNGVVEKYLSECKDQACKNYVNNFFNKKMLLAPGKNAPGFKYKDIKGTEIALQDFKGELVYMEFWATW